MADLGGNKTRRDDEPKGAAEAAPGDLAAFSARLSAHRKSRPEPSVSAGRGAAMGMAFRLSTELVAGLVVGGAIGWLLDKWLGSGPWFLLIFFFLGTAAGILNVFRTAKQLAGDAERNGDIDKRGGSPDDR